MAQGCSSHSGGMECVIGVSNPFIRSQTHTRTHTMRKAGCPAEAARVGFRKRDESIMNKRERDLCSGKDRGLMAFLLMRLYGKSPGKGLKG